jgi:parallel beta helix pectate lyase-like protein
MKTIGIVVFAVCLCLMGVVPASAAVQCGDTIVSSVTLTQNLHCTNDPALTIGADNITVNFASKEVIGFGSGTGLLVNGHKNVVLTTGYFEGFETGILVENSVNVVLSGMTAEEDGTGLVVDNSQGTQVLSGLYRQNDDLGIHVTGGSSQTLLRWMNIRFGGDGLLIDGGSSGTQGQSLVVTGGTGTGLMISDASNTKVTGTSVRYFGGDGIVVTPGAGATDATTIDSAVVTSNGGAGVVVLEGTTNTLLSRNGVNSNGADGIVTAGAVTLTRNQANFNAGHGINAGPGAIVGGANAAKGNKTPPQCVGITCQ